MNTVEVNSSHFAKLSFHGYRVLNTTFDLNPHADDGPRDLEFKIESHMSISEDGDRGRVILKSTIFPDSVEKNQPFTLAVSLEGQFSFAGELDSSEKKRLIKTNAVAILFPYLRAVVTNITSIANVTPMILPTLNIAELLRQENNHSSTTE